MPKYRRTWTLTCKLCGKEFKRKHFFKPLSICDECRAKAMSGLLLEMNKEEFE